MKAATPPRVQRRKTAVAGFACIAVDVARYTTDEGKPPPSEFRLFRKGWNGAEADPDRVLFDDKAAAAVLAAQEKHGVDRMIDLEHRSLDKESASYDGDARGWCRLEVRDGELWAVDVRWTEDGSRRLEQKTQRYVSPAFAYDKKTKRISSIFNIALTALPATHDAQELVAAEARTPRDLRKLSAGMSLNEVQTAIGAALRALYPSDDDACMSGPWVCDVFDASVVYEYDGKLFETPYSLSGSAVTLGTPVEVKRSYQPITAAPASATQTARYAAGGQMDPKLITEALDALVAGDTEKCAELLKNIIASAAGGAPAAEEPPAGGGEMGGQPPPGEEEPAPAMAAASARLLTLTAKPSLGEAVEIVETWRESHMTLTAERERVAKQRAVLEADERDSLTVELAKILGPGVAWANPLEATDRSKRKPAAAYAVLPLAELREHVTKIKLAQPASKGAPPDPTPAPEGLTEDQLRYAAEYGAKPEDVAALKRQLGR